MALFVKISDRCKTEMERHGRQDDVYNYRDKMEKNQRILMDHIRNDSRYWKKRIGNLRLIARAYEYHNHVVLAFLGLIPRGSNEYKSFLNNPIYVDDTNTSNNLNIYINSRLQDNNVSHDKTKPSDYEENYLWNVNGYIRNDYYVCESEDWVKAVRDVEVIKNRLIKIPDLLFEVIKPDNKDDDWLIDERIHLVGRNFSKYSRLFLAAALDKNDKDYKKKLKTIKERYNNILCTDSNSITADEIHRMSRRAYPHIMLCDEDQWKKMQEDELSNLALSPEETTILESVHKPNNAVNTNAGFPLFINGQAGSGKSTILQYLFADYLNLYLQQPDPEGKKTPLFFTCSNDLLVQCRRIVHGLLLCNHKYLEDYEQQNIEIEELDKFFKEFHVFLKSLLTRDGKNSFYPGKRVDFSKFNYPGKRVDFIKFKELWADWFREDPRAIKNYGPDISWHVIRRYIKGFSEDDYLDQEDYQELNRNEKTVDHKTYKAIFDKVWNKYNQECEENDYWDDQDLARELLNDDDTIMPMHPVIFCDEAQDLTHIELEVLFRLSLFSRRSLTGQDLNRVPFAFAGDPFQTLNPTGFRWDAIKSIFYEKFIASLEPSACFGNISINYKELSFNYRSTSKIVNLCNSIQALRSVLFDIRGIEPQTTWQYEQGSPPPVYFIKNQHVMDKLKEQTNLTIIVPCFKGEENNYVINDESLNKTVKKDDTGVPMNVLSAVRAKGLEFERVVLYGFGKDCPEDLFKRLDKDENTNNYDAAQSLPHEYFVNRLYVATSRAKRRLFIIEDADCFNNLWRFVNEEQTIKSILEGVRNKEDWKNNYGYIYEGDDNSWNEDKEEPQKIAKQLKESGINEKDSFKLRQAAQYYDQDSADQKLCLAYAYEYEGNCLQAGNTFKNSGYYKEALEAYWEGCNYDNIIELNKHVNDDLKYRIADFIESNKPNTTPGKDILKSFTEYMCNDNVYNEVRSRDSWTKAIKRVINKLIDKECESDDGDWKTIGDFVYDIMINKYCFGISKTKIGEFYYRACDWERAVEQWDGAVNEDDYRKIDYIKKHHKEAKVKYLFHKLKTGELDEITINTEEANLLAEYYTKKKDYHNAAKYWFKAKNETKLVSVSKEAEEENDKVYAAELALKLYVQHKQWDKLVDFAQNSGSDRSKNILNKAVSIILKSYFLTKENRNIQNKVSELLKSYFLNDPGSWAQHYAPEEAGAAIERTCLDIDALKFYEMIIKDQNLSREQKVYAKRRWTKCKYRQIERMKRKGHNEAAERYEEDAKKWKITKQDVDSLPKYPSLGRIDKSSKPDKIIDSDYFVILYFKNDNIIRIKHKNTLDTENIPMTKSDSIYKSDKWDIQITTKNNEIEINVSKEDIKYTIKR